MSADQTAQLQKQLQALVEGALRDLQGSAAPPSPEAAVPPARYGPYHEAAAVLSTFDPAHLEPAPLPPGEQTTQGDIESLMADSVPVRDPRGRDRWTLLTDVRQQVLRQLGSRKRVDAVLQANAHDQPDDPTQAMFEAYLRGEAPPLEQQDARQVAGTFEVAHWLSGLDLAQPLPDRDAIRSRGEWLGLLQPFYDLAGTHFAGRQKKLQRLRDYVGVLPPGSVRERISRFFQRIFDLHEKPPIMIHGIGGSGKSALVARFIWEHTTLTDTERFPFAYLDFDRPALLPEEPLTLLVEAVRQLGLQYPNQREYCNRVRREWQAQLTQRARLKRAGRATVGGVVSTPWEQSLPDFAHLLGNLKLEEDPFLLVLDTFEQAQYRGEEVVASLGRFLAAFQRHVPRLRTVLAGRAPIGDRTDFPTDPIELRDFDPVAAQAFLEAQGVTPPALARTIADQVGGNPLSLKLAAEVWRKEGKSAGGIPDLVVYGVKENQIQGQLFRRIIEAIHDPKVQRLAHPGLVLRRVTPELIREVLARPCEVEVPDDTEAQRLFDELRREVSLVRIEGDALRHRPDVRRIMIDLLRETDQEKVHQIETAAVAYYERRDGPVERAEELYHRLSLQQPFEEIEPRWPTGRLLEGSRQHLYSALEELNIRERAWLASRLGRTLTPEEREQADLEGWERDTARRVRELLGRDRVSEALVALHERPDRRPGSLLYPLEAEAWERQGNLIEARRILAEGIAAAAEVGDRRQAIDLRLRGARIDLRLGDFEAAGQKLDQADGWATNRGDDAVRRLEIGLLRLTLRRAKGQGPAAADAVKAELNERFGRLTDRQVAAQPPLAAWLAVELGENQPDALYRVVRLTGLETGQQLLLRALGRALAEWDSQASKEAGEPPGLLARKADVALPAARTMDQRWTTFVLRLNPATLGELVARLPNLAPAPAVPARVPAALIEILRERAREVATLDVASAASSDQSTGSGQVSYGWPGTGSAVQQGAAWLGLTGQQRRRFHRALLSAFQRDELAEMVKFRLGRNLDAIAPTADLADAVLRLVGTAEAEGWAPQLLVAARESRPDNAELLALARELDLATAAPSAPELERTLRRSGSRLDAAQWEVRLGILEARICRVEVGPSGSATYGTGFLVGPDLVMTSYQLVEDAIKGRNRPPEVALRFDYKQLPDGTILHPGTVYRLASSDWLIDASAYSPVDLEPDPGPAVPEPDQLDYALLRVAGEPGHEPIGGGSAEAAAALRGWITWPNRSHDFAPDTPLFILQYLEDGRVELAGDVSDMIGLNGNATRVRYRTRTKPGAAGSPCFDANLELIALHQRTYRGRRLGFLQTVVSQGTPISAIVARLEQRGIGGLLGLTLRFVGEAAMSLQRVVVTYRQVSTVLNQNVLNRIGSPLEATSIRAHLDEALQELRTAERTPGVLASPEHQGAALLQSFLAKRAIEAQKLEPLPTGALEAKFDDRDWLAWAGSFFTWWKGIIPHRWLTAPAHAEVFPNTARLAMLGDWGTGMYGAPVSAKSIENDPKGYHLLMHLGDVYYSGTDDEVNERFLELWPKSAHAVSRSLNSNHEMYTGGHAYFQLTLRRFQQPASYFALQNDHWMLVGLDSAYEEHDLAHGQVEWLRNIVREAGDRKIILFSHHQPFSWFEKQGPKLTAKLNEFLTARKIFAWYWGHEHRCILYEPHPLWGFYGRCIGHGGYPYFRDDLSAASLVSGQSISTWRKLEATSTAPGGLILDGPNPYVPQHENEYGPQGYVTLEFSDAHLHEVVYLPDGTQVYARQLA